jgi:hypothetical protein
MEDSEAPTPESPEVTVAVEGAKILIALRRAKARFSQMADSLAVASRRVEAACDRELRARADLHAEGDLAAGAGLHDDREGDDP